MIDPRIEIFKDIYQVLTLYNSAADCKNIKYQESLLTSKSVTSYRPASSRLFSPGAGRQASIIAKQEKLLFRASHTFATLLFP